MIDLPRAVDALVTAATSQVDPRSLKGVVENVLDVFETAGPAKQRAALRAIGRALGKVDGRGAQILSLALGALVESGAPPELAWSAVGAGLADLLDSATAFATAVVTHAKDRHLDVALERSGAVVAKKKPREAEAWKATPSRCLAAVACLTRSKKLRSRVRKDAALANACLPLSEVVSEVGYLFYALSIVDDTELLVLAPDAGLGWRVAIDAMPSNTELYILLADALLGGPKRGRLPGKRPDARAVAVVRGETPPPKRASSVIVPFHLIAWTALEADGSLAPADGHHHEGWIPMEGIPAEIPAGPRGTPVVLVQEADHIHPIPAEPSFESLRPDLRVTAELSSEEVRRTLLRLGKAAAGPKTGGPRRSSAKKATAPKKAKATAPKKAKATAPKKAKATAPKKAKATAPKKAPPKRTKTKSKA